MSLTQFEVYKLGGGYKKWKKQIMLLDKFEIILFNANKAKKAEVHLS